MSVDGRARIQSEGKVFLVAGENLKLKPEADSFPHHLLDNLIEDTTSSFLKQEQKTSKSPNLPNSIDLHIEVLAPQMTGMPAGSIIEYQLEACKNFIMASIAANKQHVTIIHGKGQGVLKREVEALLATFGQQARFKIPKNDGGAVEVWLS
jgi:hypothetical protein